MALPSSSSLFSRLKKTVGFRFHLKLRRKAVFLLFLMALSAIVFEEVADDVFQDPSEGDFEVHRFDEAVSGWVQAYRSPPINEVMRDFTSFGSVSVITALLLLLIATLYVRRDLLGILYLVAVSAGSAFWPGVLKAAFARTRPNIADHLVYVADPSFPSGHAFGAAAIYFAMAFYWAQYLHGWRRQVSLYCFTAFIVASVAVSRVYLGVHFPTDVIAGSAAGLFWAALVSLVYLGTLSLLRRKAHPLPNIG